MTPFDISALPGKKRALYHICVLLIYALIGWIWETVTLSAMAGHYVKRGFLILPFCLIYGFGANFILLLYRKLKKLNPAAFALDRKSTRLNSSHPLSSRMPSSA